MTNNTLIQFKHNIMKTQNNRLGFNKNSIVELNTEAMSTINGGSWTVLVDYINDKLKTITQ